MKHRYRTWKPKENSRRWLIVTNDDGNHYEKVAVFSNEECVDKFDTWIKEFVRESYGAVEPKHERWIMKPNGYGTCSNCKVCSLDIMGGVHSNYCPNCGAKMDEVIE